MKQKILTMILIGSTLLMTLAGCANFSYGNPAKADSATTSDRETGADSSESESAKKTTDESKRPDSSETTAAKEGSSAVGSTQEESKATAKESETATKESQTAAKESETAAKESGTAAKTDTATQEPFDLEAAFGDKVGTYDYLGVKCTVYTNGAVLLYMDEYAVALPEEIVYEGVTYPVIAFGEGFAASPGAPIGSEYEIPTHIKYILYGAFKKCKQLERLVIPDTVIYVSGIDTFWGCENLESITFMGEYETDLQWADTFGKCTALQTAITIPECVTDIDGTFKDCKSLESVSLPSNLQRIGGYTFQNCEKIEEILIPDSVTTISGYNIANLYVSAFGGTAIKHINIPEGIETFPPSTFSDCSELEELIIPDSVTSYSDTTYAHGDFPQYPELTNMDSLKTLKFSENCKVPLIKPLEAPNLELIIFPDSITQIDERLFTYVEDKSNLTIQVPAETVQYFQNRFPEINVVAKE
ncbi:MAG: leucine-rich repeat protein [Acetatifactor muris]|nr:leucine-rich repeat protein [Acetatifactor muris]MCM1528225.1 leucine-rich repeat protein [Bacteroides sp.]